MYVVSSITTDLIAKRIYYCDSRLDYIETAKYDGSDRQVVVSGVGFFPHPQGIATFESLVYWTDWTLMGVMAVSKFKGVNSMTTVYSSKNESVSSFPMGISVYHPLKQIQSRKCGLNQVA